MGIHHEVPALLEQTYRGVLHHHHRQHVRSDLRGQVPHQDAHHEGGASLRKPLRAEDDRNVQGPDDAHPHGHRAEAPQRAGGRQAERRGRRRRVQVRPLRRLQRQMVPRHLRARRRQRGVRREAASAPRSRRRYEEARQGQGRAVSVRSGLRGHPYPRGSPRFLRPLRAGGGTRHHRRPLRARRESGGHVRTRTAVLDGGERSDRFGACRRLGRVRESRWRSARPAPHAAQRRADSAVRRARCRHADRRRDAVRRRARPEDARRGMDRGGDWHSR